MSHPSQDASSNGTTSSAAPPLAPHAWLRWDVVERGFGDEHLGDVVEVGCGQGAFGVRLAARARSYRAFEPSSASYDVARKRLDGVDNAQVENRPLPLDPIGAADVLCAFEVLEHLEDDRQALEEWRRWLRPGGRVMLSVPAHEARFGPWDEAVGHYRRYGREQLATLLTAAGFAVHRVAAYGYPLGLVLETARNRLAPPVDGELDERTSKSGRLLQPAPWLGAATSLATLPFRWLQRPFEDGDRGTGWVAVARRID